MSDTQRWREAADQLRLLGHPVRLALLDSLSRGPKCVTDMQDLLEVRQANISQHLSVLRRAKIVDYHEDGNLRCYYILRPGLVRDLMRFIGHEHPSEPKNLAAVRRAAQARRSRSAAQSTPAWP